MCNVQSAIVFQSNTPSAKCHITEARSIIDADDEGAEEIGVDEDWKNMKKGTRMRIG